MKLLDVIMKYLTKKFACIHCVHVNMKSCSVFYALDVFQKWEMKYYPDHFKIRDVVEVVTWRVVVVIGYIQCSLALSRRDWNEIQTAYEVQ